SLADDGLGNRVPFAGLYDFVRRPLRRIWRNEPCVWHATSPGASVALNGVAGCHRLALRDDLQAPARCDGEVERRLDRRALHGSALHSGQILVGLLSGTRKHCFLLWRGWLA